MKVTPRSEEELNAMNLIDPGIYNFEIIEAKEGLSKKGHEMITLKLCVYDSNGREHIVFDYLLDAMPHKMRHFADAMEIIDAYSFGNISASDCEGKSGKCEIIIQKGQMKPDGSGFYADKNSVKDYVKSGVTANPKGRQPVTDDFLDDQIPF